MSQGTKVPKSPLRVRKSYVNIVSADSGSFPGYISSIISSASDGRNGAAFTGHKGDIMCVHLEGTPKESDISVDVRVFLIEL